MSDHIKRLAAPRTWPLKRKIAVWATKQSPGAHSIESSLPAVIVLRDLIGACDTSKEAKRIIGDRELIVDGRPVKNPKAPIGVMDTVSIPKLKENYRVLLSDKGKLTLVAIPEDHATWKLVRIEGKTKIAGGKIQLNLSGGRNITLDANQYHTGDTLKIDVLEQKILASYPVVSGAPALIINGALTGKVDTISEKIQTKGSTSNTIKFVDGTETVTRNVFVIGATKPEITLPEVSE
jgi:small subunit ribosomal protein S4e